MDLDAIAESTRSRDEFVVANTDGSGRRSLTRSFGDGVPAWSPDGQMIAFSTGRSIPTSTS